MLQSLKEFINSPVSPYTGSTSTKTLMEQAVEKKYGKTELKNLDCYHNMRTFSNWLSLGWKVRKGEKAFKSIVVREIKDKNGNVIKKITYPCFLFYYRQVEKIDSNNSHA
ncbi:MAG: ArdC-like ssDNA-binding domain-containing protein [archaeon]